MEGGIKQQKYPVMNQLGGDSIKSDLNNNNNNNYSNKVNLGINTP